ncbi:hypothetical protein [uncultured Limimaricola sp.]|uniref:hypothetical protein n=1 Tax=uncultured Limimaricola sp. TaxID=2211667 RepID=UPI0030FAE64D
MTFTPLMQRVALAKSLGLLFGLLAPALLTTTSPSETMLVWGVVLWAVMLGALVGLIGVFDRVPLFDIRLPLGIRGGWVGLWMGVMLLLVAQDGLEVLWARSDWLPQPGPGVWWIVIEATLIGALIDLAVTAVTGSVERHGTGRTRSDH